MSANNSLYEITGRFAALQDLSEAETDEGMLEAISDTLEGIEGEFEDKAEAVVRVMNNVVVDVPAIDAQIERLQARKKVIVNKQERMRDYLKQNMEKTGINKISCPLFTITLSKAADQVEITDLDSLPIELVNVETKITPIKAEIKKALKDNVLVPGAKMVKGTRRLMIK